MRFWAVAVCRGGREEMFSEPDCDVRWSPFLSHLRRFKSDVFVERVRGPNGSHFTGGVLSDRTGFSGEWFTAS